MKILFFVFLLTAFAFAQSAEPYTIDSDVLGETSDTYRLNHEDERQDCIVNPGADRFTDESTPGLKACTTSGIKQPMTFAGVKVESRLVRFDDEKLYEMVYRFNSASVSKEAYGVYYDQLRAALIEKYGKPAEEQHMDSADAGDSHSRNETATWKNGLTTIVLKKFVGDRYTTTITFSLDKLEEDARHQIEVTRQHRSEM